MRKRLAIAALFCGLGATTLFLASDLSAQAPSEATYDLARQPFCSSKSGFMVYIGLKGKGINQQHVALLQGVLRQADMRLANTMSQFVNSLENVRDIEDKAELLTTHLSSVLFPLLDTHRDQLKGVDAEFEFVLQGTRQVDCRPGRVRLG